MRMSLATCCLFLLMATGASWAQNALRSTVVKYDQGNPSLGIVGFSGDAATRQLLEKVLRRTDWFQVVKQDQASRAQIQLKVGGTPTNLSATVTVAGKSPFTVTGTGETANDAVFQLVDAILKQIFKVPALCTRPIAYVLSSTNSTTGRPMASASQECSPTDTFFNAIPRLRYLPYTRLLSTPGLSTSELLRTL